MEDERLARIERDMNSIKEFMRELTALLRGSGRRLAEIVEAMDEEEGQQKGEAATFAVFAMIGQKVVLKVSGGSTNNFISKELVTRLEIPRKKTQRFRVSDWAKVVEGEGGEPAVFEGEEECHGVVLRINGIEIVENFFVTDLKGIADVLLGGEWLARRSSVTLTSTLMALKREEKMVRVEAEPSLLKRGEQLMLMLEKIQAD